MSFQFNDTTNYLGLVQLFEREIGANQGDVSGSTTRLKEFTADTKGAFDRFFAIALPASGTWQLDDSNQTDYPIITTNIVSAQRDYAFTLDGSSNLILDIYRVAILGSASATTYQEIEPVDTQSDLYPGGLVTNDTTGGTPVRYDKTGNGIFLDPVPNYNATNGLKIWINREASYFTSSDTTKKPGVPGLFHGYFYLKPASDYARRNNLANQDRLQSEVLRMEQDIKRYFSERPRDERKQITTRPIRFR